MNVWKLAITPSEGEKKIRKEKTGEIEIKWRNEIIIFSEILHKLCLWPIDKVPQPPSNGIIC